MDYPYVHAHTHGFLCPLVYINNNQIRTWSVYCGLKYYVKIAKHLNTGNKTKLENIC
jgi:hypothetical protein